MNEQVCTKAVDTCGYPVETTGNAVLDTLEHRSSTRAFARDDDDRPVAVTDEQRAAILHAASRAPSAGAMMMYSIVSIREQATLDRLADLCDHQPMIAKAPWALIFVVDYAKWIDLFEHVGCFEPEFVERTGKAPRRAPGLGDFAIAAQDAVIAAQNAVVAAEALGLGSCYIGDIVENAEEVAELLDLPPYTMPLSMLIIGTPPQGAPGYCASRGEPGARGALLPRRCCDHGRAGGRDGRDVSPACPRGGRARGGYLHPQTH